MDVRGVYDLTRARVPETGGWDFGRDEGWGTGFLQSVGTTAGGKISLVCAWHAGFKGTVAGSFCVDKPGECSLTERPAREVIAPPQVCGFARDRISCLGLLRIQASLHY